MNAAIGQASGPSPRADQVRRLSYDRYAAMAEVMRLLRVAAVRGACSTDQWSGREYLFPPTDKKVIRMKQGL